MTKKERMSVREAMKIAAQEGAEGLKKQLKARGLEKRFRVTATRSGVKIRRLS